MDVKKNNAIEFYRFIFSCIICVHHYRGHSPSPVFEGGYLGVDVFFVLSGFLLMRHFMRNSQTEKELTPELNAFSYTKKRFKSYFPHHVFSWVCNACVLVALGKYTISQILHKGFWEFLLLKSTGLGNDFSVNGVSWYLSALLLGSFLIYWILSLTEKKSGTSNLYIYVIAPFLYFVVMARIWDNTGHLNYWTQSAPVLTGGFWRGLAEMGLGCITCLISSNRSKREVSKTVQLLATCLEVIMWFVILKKSFCAPDKMDFLVPVLAAFCFYSCFSLNSYLTKMLDNRLSAYLGMISFPIYLNHLFIQKIADAFFSEVPFWPVMSLILIATIVFSIFSHLLVDALSSVIEDFISGVSKGDNSS